MPYKFRGSCRRPPRLHACLLMHASVTLKNGRLYPSTMENNYFIHAVQRCVITSETKRCKVIKVFTHTHVHTQADTQWVAQLNMHRKQVHFFSTNFFHFLNTQTQKLILILIKPQSFFSFLTELNDFWQLKQITIMRTCI